MDLMARNDVYISPSISLYTRLLLKELLDGRNVWNTESVSTDPPPKELLHSTGEFDVYKVVKKRESSEISAKFVWCLKGEEPWKSVFLGNTIVNRFLFRNGLVSKDGLWRSLVRYYGRDSASNVMPETFILEPEDDEDIVDTARLLQKKHGMYSIWIVKPANSSNAISTCVFQALNTESCLHMLISADDTHDRWIIQRYVDSPLLTSDGRKFHVRAFVLCAGWLTCYLHQNMLCLSASKKYSKDPEGFKDSLVHLTNLTIQETGNTFTESECIQLLRDSHAEQFPIIFTNIKGAVRRVFESLRPDDRSSSRKDFVPVSSAFEVFGFDILVLEDLSVRVLEVNSSPHFKGFGTTCKDACRKLLDDVLSLTIDRLYPPVCGDERSGEIVNGFVKVYETKETECFFEPSGADGNKEISGQEQDRACAKGDPI
eukprot:Rmarinus@m.13856